MPLSGDYEPSALQWVRDQVETYERTGGKEAATLRDTGIPVSRSEEHTSELQSPC